MNESERASFTNLVTAPRKEGKWTPLPGPQTLALASKADSLFYGGAAGGGKTDLALGLALSRHRRAIIFRREYGQLRAIIERLTEILGNKSGYNGQDKLWRLATRSIEFGACQHIGDERRFQGRAHDLKVFDEITHFTEEQFRYLSGWLRSTAPDQRCRILCTGNPPTDASGDWVIRHWGPWLDPTHPKPAKPGELRWYAVIKGKERELESGAPFIHNGERIWPQSRSFIPSRVEDNPYLMRAGYKATLQALPEPLRSQMLEGRFDTGREDNEWQVIPTAWIAAAQARWSEQAETKLPLEMIGVDVARGGRDRTVLVPRYGHHIGKPHIHPGRETPDGGKVAALVTKMMQPGAIAAVDVIGPGGSVVDHLTAQGQDVLTINAAEKHDGKDRRGRLGFFNLRACLWWRLREALDPDNHAPPLTLPPGREILTDLAAPRWSLTARGIQIEAKDDIKKRVGRSPDIGDAITYALADRALGQPRIRGL